MFIIEDEGLNPALGFAAGGDMDQLDCDRMRARRIAGKANLMGQRCAKQCPCLVRLTPISDEIKIDTQVERVERVLACAAALDSKIETGGLLSFGKSEKIVEFQLEHMDEDRSFLADPPSRLIASTKPLRL